MKKLLFLFTLLKSLLSFSQTKTHVNQFYYVDTIKIKNLDKIIYIGYKSENDESHILVKQNEKSQTYDNVLNCYSCLGRNADGQTDIGHSTMDNTIVLVQMTLFGKDSIFIDFTSSVPLVTKVVTRSFSPTLGPDNPGSHIYTAKKGMPLSKFSSPLDKDNPLTKKYFDIKKIKWVQLDEAGK